MASNASISTDQIDEPASNPNSLDREKFRMLCEAIEAYGFLQPVLVRANGARYTIVDGVHRVRAAKALGIASVPAVIADGIAETDASILQIGMNRLRGELDLSDVAVTLQRLRDDGIDADVLQLTGFNAQEINALVSSLDEKDVDPRDAAEPPPVDADDEPKVRPHVLELTFETREELQKVKKVLRRAAGGGRNAKLERGLLALIEG